MTVEKRRNTFEVVIHCGPLNDVRPGEQGKRLSGSQCISYWRVEQGGLLWPAEEQNHSLSAGAASAGTWTSVSAWTVTRGEMALDSTEVKFC